MVRTTKGGSGGERGGVDQGIESRGGGVKQNSTTSHNFGMETNMANDQHSSSNSCNNSLKLFIDHMVNSSE